MLEWISMIIALSMPYQGPLAERQIPMPDTQYVGVISPIDPIGPDAMRVRLLARRLEHDPIAVRAPDFPELGYGLMGADDHVLIVRFNLLLVEAAQGFAAAGAYPPGEDDSSVFAAARVLQGGLPNSGEVVEWAVGALDSLGVRHPAYPFADFADEGPANFGELIADWKAHGSRYDREMVRGLLQRWGLDARVMLEAVVGPGKGAIGR